MHLSLDPPFPRETTPPRPTKLPSPLPLASGQSRKGEERFAFSFPGSGPRPAKESALDSQKAQQATAVNFTWHIYVPLVEMSKRWTNVGSPLALILGTTVLVLVCGCFFLSPSLWAPTFIGPELDYHQPSSAWSNIWKFSQAGVKGYILHWWSISVLAIVFHRTLTSPIPQGNKLPEIHRNCNKFKQWRKWSFPYHKLPFSQ